MHCVRKSTVEVVCTSNRVSTENVSERMVKVKDLDRAGALSTGIDTYSALDLENKNHIACIDSRTVKDIDIDGLCPFRSFVGKNACVVLESIVHTLFRGRVLSIDFIGD